MIIRRKSEDLSKSRNGLVAALPLLLIGLSVLFVISVSSNMLIRLNYCTHDFASSQEGLIIEEDTIQRRNTITEETELEVSKKRDSLSVDHEENTWKEDSINQIIAEMSLEQKVAQLFIITPEALTGVSQVTAAGETTREAYRKYPVGGIIYFEGNIISRDQWIELSGNMQSISREITGIPVFLAVDEEGGRVTRFSGRIDGLPYIPPMSAIGDSGDSQDAYDVGLTIGNYLKELNVNLDFAPVADVNSNPDNTVIGDRSFSGEAAIVSEMVSSEISGIHDSGVLCTVKHFPGHGDTAGDSHAGLVYSYKNKDELYDCELQPFIAGIEAGVDFIMVGHIALPEVTGNDTPASLSYPIITDLLRGELGYDGIVITDALNMGAVTNRYNSAEVAVMCISAGVDMMLMPADFGSAYYGIINAIEDGRISIDRINQSVYRILKKKMEFDL